MRRALALLLMAVFSFPLIAPAWIAGNASDLPACCRRNGKHHCAMAAADTGTASGSVVRTILPKCPNYPTAHAAPGERNVALPQNSQAVFASLFHRPTVQTRTESKYRVSFSRSRSKRGPPTLLS
jgi:hypothetical protein